ncbi:sialidase family protein [Tundrisphaera sp. TA3]|uniref:sialidase family protein n=1 Tax=Tundrisphaera sp. TA3 TaxID=3435775 RepID=UPI003EBEF9D0
MTRMLIALAGILLAGTARADDPILERQTLFEANTGGYALYRIPGLVATKAGTLLAYCEARKHSRSDWGTIDIVMRRSTDGGKTWGPARKIAAPPPDARKNPVAPARKDAPPGEFTLNNPVAIADPETGAVHVLYCVEYARCFHMRSDDDGATFSPPVEITPAFDRFRPEYDWNVLATGPGHGIRLSGGRLVVPVWLSTGKGQTAHRPSVVSTIASDDGGKTWARGAIVVADPRPSNPSESSTAELSDGRVMLNVRHESEPRLRGISISPDGLSGWSPMRFDPALPDPVCFGSLARMPADPARLLFVNLDNAASKERRNLTVRMSRDDGRTWPVARALEPGTSGYADLAVGPDGVISCFYESGSSAKGSTVPPTLQLARFNPEWLAAPKSD